MFLFRSLSHLTTPKVFMLPADNQFIKPNEWVTS
jgi:hypothetical protein